MEPHPEEGTAEILYVLDQLEDMVGVSKQVPFSNKVMVEEEFFLDLVEQLRIAIPTEVRQAQRVVRDRSSAHCRSADGSLPHHRSRQITCRVSDFREWHSQRSAPASRTTPRTGRGSQKRELGEIDVYAMEQFNLVAQAVQDSLDIVDRALHETLSEIDRARNSVGR
ncbi:MAG: hypothetical protein R2839_09865 [Thermomicrobiales bacterium]